MVRFLLLFCLVSFVAFSSFAQQPPTARQNPETCFTQTEKELFRLINEYRSQKGLPEVKLSVSLCYVARTHAQDQTENFKNGGRCNMHSWSDNGKWSSCCYTPDHKKSQCMWDKPRELTNYEGDGFEISYWSTYQFETPEAQAKDILNGWKKSPGHNDVIMNKGIWKAETWNAIGIGVYGEYANVWFGEKEDAEGEPEMCE